MDTELRKCKLRAGAAAGGPRRKKPGPPFYAGADIAVLEAGGFLRNARRRDVTIGSTSLYEIGRLIDDHKDQRDGLEMDGEELRQLIAEKCAPQFE